MLREEPGFGDLRGQGSLGAPGARVMVYGGVDGAVHDAGCVKDAEEKGVWLGRGERMIGWDKIRLGCRILLVRIMIY